MIERAMVKSRKDKKIYKYTERDVVSEIVCSPRIIPQPGSEFETRCISRCWKTRKRGKPKPKKAWQRHGEIKRYKYGRVRCYYYPSVRILNELGLCIYPDVIRVEEVLERWEQD